MVKDVGIGVRRLGERMLGKKRQGGKGCGLLIGLLSRNKAGYTATQYYSSRVCVGRGSDKNG